MAIRLEHQLVSPTFIVLVGALDRADPFARYS